MSIVASAVPTAYFDGSRLIYDLTVETADDVGLEVPTTAWLVDGTWRTDQTSTVDGSVADVTVDVAGGSAMTLDSQGDSVDAKLDSTQR